MPLSGMLDHLRQAGEVHLLVQSIPAEDEQPNASSTLGLGRAWHMSQTYKPHADGIYSFRKHLHWGLFALSGHVTNLVLFALWIPEYEQRHFLYIH